MALRYARGVPRAVLLSSFVTSRVPLSVCAQVYLMDRSDVRPNERGVSVHLPRHKGDQESATSMNQLNHNAQCPLRGFGGGWARNVTSASALPCALRRCGACIVMLHKTRAPYEPDEDGPFFLHFPPSACFSFDIETAMVGGGDDAEEMYCALPPAPSRGPASYKSFNDDLTAVGIYHNRIAGDRGWVLLDLIRLSFHAWRHGAITNAFVLKHDELAICIAFRLRSAAVMKHYIAKKLGVLMPGNASAHLAGAAVAMDRDEQARCFDHSLAAAFSHVIVSQAQAYELPAVTHEQARQLNVDEGIAMWLGHQ